MKLVFKKFTVEKSEKDRYFLIVEDTNTDEVFNIEVGREIWDNYIEGDELKISNDPIWQKPLSASDPMPPATEEILEQLQRAAKELENDPEFQKDLSRSVEEEKILYLEEALKEAWHIMDKIHDNDDVDEWQNEYEHIVFKDAFEDLEREDANSDFY